MCESPSMLFEGKYACIMFPEMRAYLKSRCPRLGCPSLLRPPAQEGTAHHMNAPAPCIPSARLQGVTSTTAPALQASKQAAKTPSRLTNSSSVPLMERALDAASNVVCNAVGSTGLGAVGVVASAAVRLLRAGG